MKRVAYGMALPVGLLLVLSGIALAQGEIMGRGGMGGGMGMMGPRVLEDEESEAEMEMMGQPRGGMMGPGMQRGRGPEGRPMMPMQGMMHQMGGMMEQLAAQVQVGQMTPEQMQRLGEVMGDMAEMMRGMSGMMSRGMMGGMEIRSNTSRKDER